MLSIADFRVDIVYLLLRIFGMKMAADQKDQAGRQLRTTAGEPRAERPRRKKGTARPIGLRRDEPSSVHVAFQGETLIDPGTGLIQCGI